jgi:DNA polymerase I
MSYLHELVKGFGITQFSLEGFEADDLIATITKRAEKEGAEVLICTGDRDSFQLVTRKRQFFIQSVASVRWRA